MAPTAEGVEARMCFLPPGYETAMKIMFFLYATVIVTGVVVAVTVGLLGR
jgi:hypothetical protein